MIGNPNDTKAKVQLANDAWESGFEDEAPSSDTATELCGKSSVEKWHGNDMISNTCRPSG